MELFTICGSVLTQICILHPLPGFSSILNQPRLTLIQLVLLFVWYECFSLSFVHLKPMELDGIQIPKWTKLENERRVSPWIYHGFTMDLSSQAFSPSPAATQAERPASPASVPSSPARSINSTTNSPAGRPRRGLFQWWDMSWDFSCEFERFFFCAEVVWNKGSSPQ
jgi:hypothetical protein